MRTLETELEETMAGRHLKKISYSEDVSTDESGCCSSDGGCEENIKDIRKMSSQSEENQNESHDNRIGNSIDSKIQRLQDNVARTNQFLTELKSLSESCQEYIPAIEYEVDEDGELHNERRVFIRRIVQLGAELQDAKDTILSICKECLPSRQWRILLDITGPNRKQNIEDEDLIVGMMGTCNLDPSVRFFGIEWELVFGKCFSLSLNVKIFGQQIMNSSKDTFCSSSTSAIDLILVSTLLKDLSSLEADVTSHGEAVLQGRLSKSLQRLIRREQLKNCTPLNNHTTNVYEGRRKKSMICKNSRSMASNLTKSKSFRNAGVPSINEEGRKTSEPIYKYRKNKTTNLEKLGNELGKNSTPVASSFRTSKEAAINSSSDESNGRSNDAQITINDGLDRNQNIEHSNGVGQSYSQEMKDLRNHRRNEVSIAEGNKIGSDKANQYEVPKKKSSIFQNVSSMFKNVR